jgi:long-chain acyl-CoA synthetase
MQEKPWFRNYASGVKRNLDYEQLTISQALTRSANRFPDKTALNYMGRRITYRELEGLVNRFARALKDLGIEEGDKVAVILPNLPQTIIANLATYRIGAVVVLNNPLYTERELEYQLSDSDSRIALTLTLLVPRVLSVMPGTGVEKVIGCHINSYLPFPKKQLFPFVKKDMYKKLETSEKVLLFEDLIKKYSPDSLEDKSKWDELSTLIYTGGTTGTSKGVMLSHKNMSVNVQQLRAWYYDLEDGEISLLGTYPIFHASGLTGSQNFMMWMAGEHIMIPRPEPATVVDLLKKYKPGFLPGVPTIFVGLLSFPQFREMDHSFLRGYICGAAPLAMDTIRELKKVTGADIIELYGLTEASPIVTMNPWNGKIRPGTVGLPYPDTDIAIVETGTGEKELETGEVGEVIIKGPQVMMGYYKKPEETSQVLKGEWLYTGDLGFLDEEGFLTIVDRKKDMIIASGYNIYPVEIDDVLFDHPRILEACAIGVPDPYRGETVKAFVVPMEGATLTEEEVISFCRERLAAYKVPKSVEFKDELPKSAIGKILRRELRAQEMAKVEAGEAADSTR